MLRGPLRHIGNSASKAPVEGYERRGIGEGKLTLSTVESRGAATTQTEPLQRVKSGSLDLLVTRKTSKVIASEIGDSLARRQFGLGTVRANDDGHRCEFGFLLRGKRLGKRLGSPLVDEFINFLVTRCE